MIKKERKKEKEKEIVLRPFKTNYFQYSLGETVINIKPFFLKITLDRKILNCKLLNFDFHIYETHVIRKDIKIFGFRKLLVSVCWYNKTY